MLEDVADVDYREQVFHNAVREYIISLLLFILLYVSSYVTICVYKKKSDSEDESYAGDEDAIVYRISLWLCTFTLAVSAGAVLLLPLSIISNEVLLLYPNSYYVKWLNSSLIHGLWNQIFLFSNSALIILMPFAYLFTESEGFSGSRKGIKARVYETAVVLVLLAVVVCGLAWVASALLDGHSLWREEEDHRKTLSDIWNVYLPYIYSCISFVGVLVLLLCTPVGFAHMFSVMGQLVVKPKFLRDIDEELATANLEEENLQRKLKYDLIGNPSHKIANGHIDREGLEEQLREVQADKQKLQKRGQVSSLRRNLGYPLVMLALLALTVLCLLMVVHNTFQLLVGIKALPVGAKETVLGLSSLSALGLIGAALEIILILYVMSASVVGLYSLPLLCHLRPLHQDTAMLKIIGNCIVLLILSSALPVLSKTLGITNFDLIGNFGSMDWLGNFYIILLYNGLFATATAFCLVTKVTATVREEIYVRLKTVFGRERRTHTTSTSSISGGLKEE
ncbi:hypothetical protein ScPMuIL_012270 [Solemya velum]